ncbi:MAG TPA: glutamine--fructose-6-phosphate transaminase (isomerizing) [Planctomycetota bacterium]|nr:glutamine--fructose-6-phosphate transaminase (isomerizing) [Planctomycetota bacterium]
MCGIVGCVARRAPVVGVLVGGLKRLEYRGYDSAGVAVLQDGDIKVVREVGKLRRLEDALGGAELVGRTGVGHTRWATHGKPSELNAHPHRGGKGDVVAVHNGIIENYRELRDRLLERGHVFRSETDSEVIPHLVEEYDQGDFFEAVRLALNDLEGSFAVAFIHRRHPDMVIGARKDSPLIVGLAEDRNFLASDVAAVLESTKRVIHLEEGDVAVLTPGSVEIRRLDGSKAERPVATVTWDLAQAEKGGYDHYMLKEIHEQPTVVSDGLLGRIDGDAGEVTLEGLNLTDEQLRRFNRVVVLACGTSWHAGLVGKFFIEKLARVPVEVDYASEFRYRDPVMDERSLVIAVSQSGETADTLAAVRRARVDFNARTIGVCNVQGSSIARECTGLVMTHAGPEIGVASTKAFMGQLVALQLLALKLGRARGAVSSEEARRLVDQLRRLPQFVARALGVSDRVRELAERYHGARDVLFLGRGVCYPVALEGALKLKEISYIHAEGYPAGEMKHGPIALVDEDLPVVVVAVRGPTYDKVAGNVEEARARGGRIIAVVNEGDDRVARLAEATVVVPEVDALLAPMVAVVPLQLLAYWIARRRGCDVDQPRNLAKSVTVE